MTHLREGSTTALLTLLLAGSAALLVALRLEPRVAVLQRAVADSEQQLRSDTIAFSGAPLLLAERRALQAQVGALLDGQPETTFVRIASDIARRRRVRVLSTSFVRPQPRRSSLVPRVEASFERIPGTIALEGDYPNLLAAISDLSRGNALVAVGPPVLRRGDGSLVAQVPLTLSEATGTARR